MRPWDEDEIAWAKECARAGDTAEEIAEMSGRTPDEVRARIPFPRLTDRQRKALRLYSAGATVREIGQVMKPGTTRPDSLGACYVKALRTKLGLPYRHDPRVRAVLSPPKLGQVRATGQATTATRALELLRTGPSTVAQLADQLGMTQERVRTLMNQLQMVGRAERVAPAATRTAPTWRLADEQEAAHA